MPLDYDFVNEVWDSLFPNTIMSSRTCTTLDHALLLNTISTTLPRAGCFCFKQFWHHQFSFAALFKDHLGLHPYHGSQAYTLTTRLKAYRHECRYWAKRHKSSDEHEVDLRALLDVLDLLEECRALSPPKLASDLALLMPYKGHSGINCVTRANASL